MDNQLDIYNSEISVFEERISLAKAEYEKLKFEKKKIEVKKNLLESKEIKESEFENSKPIARSRICHKYMGDLIIMFNEDKDDNEDEDEDEDNDNNEIKDKFIELLESNNMTVDYIEKYYEAHGCDLKDALDHWDQEDIRECGYNYGDMFDFGPLYYCRTTTDCKLYYENDCSHVYFVGKNSVLYKMLVINQEEPELTPISFTL